jgi:hypothetical protein
MTSQGRRAETYLRDGAQAEVDPIGFHHLRITNSQENHLFCTRTETYYAPYRLLYCL